MSVATISSLVWLRAPGLGLTAFKAAIDEDDWFTIVYTDKEPFDYRWQLRICRRSVPTGVLLHGHPSLQIAKEAAERHIGDD